VGDAAHRSGSIHQDKTHVLHLLQTAPVTPSPRRLRPQCLFEPTYNVPPRPPTHDHHFAGLQLLKLCYAFDSHGARVYAACSHGACLVRHVLTSCHWEPLSLLNTIEFQAWPTQSGCLLRAYAIIARVGPPSQNVMCCICPRFTRSGQHAHLPASLLLAHVIHVP
jgi:hypothetical protein